jgi:DNA polymerase-3 subunit gamma/tau
MELYRKYRPDCFTDVAGQKKAVTTLRNFVKDKKVPHAILFSGGSGVGKTTLARIMRTELDCHSDDFNEINCADFRGIDMIREIRKNSKYAPMKGKTKIWLIDEVHMMTTQGQNAILKLLEDPPSYVYFFLATTDPNKLIRTIRTRTTEIALEEFNLKEMTRFLQKFVAKYMEGVTLSKNELHIIHDKSEGSPRKALVILESLLSLDEEDRAQFLEELHGSEAKCIELCRALIGGAKWSEVASILRTLNEDPESVRRAVLGYARTVLLSNGKTAPRAYLVLDSFKDNFYDSHHPGLACACWEVVMEED